MDAQIGRLREKERARTQNGKEFVHNSLHYARKIDELESDLNEKEQKVEDFTLEIIRLKKDKAELQEALAAKESRLGGALLAQNAYPG